MWGVRGGTKPPTDLKPPTLGVSGTCTQVRGFGPGGSPFLFPWSWWCFQSCFMYFLFELFSLLFKVFFLVVCA